MLFASNILRAVCLSLLLLTTFDALASRHPSETQTGTGMINQQPGSLAVLDALVVETNAEGVTQARCRLEITDPSVRPGFLPTSSPETARVSTVDQTGIRVCQPNEAGYARELASFATLEPQVAGLPIAAGTCFFYAIGGAAFGMVTTPNATGVGERLLTDTGVVLMNGWLYVLAGLGGAVNANSPPTPLGRGAFATRAGRVGGLLGVTCTAAGTATGIGITYLVHRTFQSNR